MTITDDMARFVQRGLKAQAAVNKLGAGPADELARLRAVNADLLAALEEWWRLDCIKGLNPSIRKTMKRHAGTLTRAAIARAREPQP
mgnify:CR=1 FL=1